VAYARITHHPPITQPEVTTMPAVIPTDVARTKTMRRIRSQQERRQAAARNGYRGPLTRADLAALAPQRTRVS
jgi:hypothetical protein